MSRLDNFDEILKSYEERDFLGDLRVLLNPASIRTYDSLSHAFQQKITKYFRFIKKTGMIKEINVIPIDADEELRFPDCVTETAADKSPNYFDAYIHNIWDAMMIALLPGYDTELEAIANKLDLLILAYEQDEQTRQLKNRFGAAE